MKGNRSTLALLLIVTLFASCKKSDIAYENDFDNSYRVWMNFKTSSGNSYRYTVTTGSWTGSTSQTIITVKNGRATGRSYVYKTPVAQNQVELTIREQWDEDLNNLNTHTNGYPTQTLDEIYQRAKSDWLLKREDAKTYLETNNNGMISSAGYVENNCADDCFRGISISSIEKAE
ncbi:hypothetical protein ACSBL2_06095 [Pedobacter sp. AW31-3R]|uniref:hypothetical protein n=1 Tax=Pedobacter sp. AW31-3R TaxID=3445781 RepID=UPI003FA05B17